MPSRLLEFGDVGLRLHWSIARVVIGSKWRFVVDFLMRDVQGLLLKIQLDQGSEHRVSGLRVSRCLGLG